MHGIILETNRQVAMRLRDLRWGILAIFLVLLFFVWLDGGREEPRLIVQPVALPENAS